MYQVKKRFYQFFGIVIKEQQDEYKSELYKNTLNSYLTSSLSVELVNVILKTIVNFTENQNKGAKKEKKIRQSKYYKTKDGEEFFVENEDIVA
jgi:hypothetical protein